MRVSTLAVVVDNGYFNFNQKPPNMNRLLSFKKIALLALAILAYNGLFAQIQITLRQGFIDSIKNKVTISTDYIIDKAHPRPNPGSKDGDMHVAGRSEAIGLPIVAEIMNAAGQAGAMKLVHSEEGKNETVSLTGVWRLWCEHSATLTWKASTSKVAGYNVYRSTESGKNYQKINSSLVRGLTYRDNKVVSGVTYYYVTRAVDAQGHESVNSNETSVSIP